MWFSSPDVYKSSTSEVPNRGYGVCHSEVVCNDRKGRDFAIGNGVELPLQLQEKLFEMLSPVFAMAFLAISTDMRSQTMNTFETSLMAAWTLQNNL